MGFELRLELELGSLKKHITTFKSLLQRVASDIFREELLARRDACNELNLLEPTSCCALFWVGLSPHGIMG